MDRAGVKKRPYKNTMYKLVDKSQKEDQRMPLYIAVEGATPLLTFHETQENVSPFHGKYFFFKSWNLHLLN